jgi:hypothetical protein
MKNLLLLLRKHRTLEVTFETLSGCLEITVERGMGARSELGITTLKSLDESLDPEQVIESMINTLVERLYQ